jgi:hypothetical protein
MAIWKHGSVDYRTRYLHRPITIQIGNEVFSFLTIGYVAEAVGRSTANIKRWQRLGLFPRPEYWLYPNRGPASRGLYPEDFVKSLSEIARRTCPSRRMDRKHWRRFHDDVWAAFESAVASINDLRALDGARGVDLT